MLAISFPFQLTIWLIAILAGCAFVALFIADDKPEKPSFKRITGIVLAIGMFIALIVAASYHLSSFYERRTIESIASEQSDLRRQIDSARLQLQWLSSHPQKYPGTETAPGQAGTGNNTDTSLKTPLTEGNQKVVMRPDSRWGWLAIGTLLLAAGIFLLPGRATLMKKTAASALISIGSLITAKELLKFSFEISPEFNINLKEIKCNCNCEGPFSGNYKLIRKVGPFVSGYDTLQQAGIVSLNPVVDSLVNNRYSVLYVFGGVDKQQLKDQARKRFGDNLTLSKARAKKIKLYIEQLFKTNPRLQSISPPRILVYPEGAEYYSGADADSLAQDRHVSIYGVPAIK